MENFKNLMPSKFDRVETMLSCLVFGCSGHPEAQDPSSAGETAQLGELLPNPTAKPSSALFEMNLDTGHGKTVAVCWGFRLNVAFQEYSGFVSTV